MKVFAVSLGILASGLLVRSYMGIDAQKGFFIGVLLVFFLMLVWDDK